jgi:hypothetical protein
MAILNTIVPWIQYWLNIIHLYVHNRQLEPREPEWLQLFYEDNAGNYCEYNLENIIELNELMATLETPKRGFGVMMKSNSGVYCDYLLNKKEFTPPVKIENPKSQILSVLFVSKQNDTTTEISIPKELFDYTNSILFYPYIVRYFEYNVTDIEFTSDYELLAMGNDMQTFSLTPQQYIEVGLNGKFALKDNNVIR